MPGKTNLVILVFGIVITVAAARSLDIGDFSGDPQDTNAQNFEVDEGLRARNQRMKEQLMAKLLDMVRADVSPYNPPETFGGATTFEAGSLPKRSKSRYGSRWCNLVDLWKGQGGSNHRCG